MSHSNSQSGSSGSSPNQQPFFQEHFEQEHNLFRSGTVRRAGSNDKKEKDEKLPKLVTNGTDEIVMHNRGERYSSPEIMMGNRYRKSLDSCFRHSLESISEYKAKHTFIPYYGTNNTSQDISSSLESLSPEQLDYATLSSNSNTDTRENSSKTIPSPPTDEPRDSLTSSGGTNGTPRGSIPSSSRSRSSRSSARGSLPSSGISERGSIPSDGTLSRSSIPSSYLLDRQGSADSQFSSSGEGKDESKTRQASYLTVEELKLNENLRIPSPATNYLSWIESVQEEYFGKGATRVTEVPDIDSRVGEWNNFWLNYNSGRTEYLSSTFENKEERNHDDGLDKKSAGSPHRVESLDKGNEEYVTLSLEEIRETLKCCKKITDILENVLIRNDRELDNIYNMEGSFNSEPVLSRQSSSVREESKELSKEDLRKIHRARSQSYVTLQQQGFGRERSQSYVTIQHQDVGRERSHSYAPTYSQNQQGRERSQSYITNYQEWIRQTKEAFKPAAAQSSSSSCINALLNNTGLPEMFKRVLNKTRKEDDLSTMNRHSFSNWGNK
ncbi:unnamed protein product [Acanthoscelides obtectus]|uniref:Uncharacterized protein n=1 Tax=Acanthoscelides obtectus TaxID=200917 RepID=A0A9P0Q2R4_ACAOB|nr:unnamed protein product [Acanthoscelides obtectus]CAK1638803.1 hypothetical protein AOBTE_LOCUS10826 [Acanthoscelides obtectus]